MSVNLNSNPLFQKELRLLKIFGLSLYKNNSLIYKIYSIFIMIFVIILYPILDIAELFHYEFEGIASIILYAGAVSMAMIKATVYYRHSTNVRNIIDRLNLPPFAVNYERGGSKEEELVKNCIKITNIQAWAYWIFAYVTFSGGVTYTIVNGIIKHTYDPMYGPISVLDNNNTWNYCITAIYQNVSLFYFCAHYTTIDLITVGILVHVVCQLKMLQHSLKHIVTNSHRLMCKTTDCDFLLDCTNNSDIEIIAPNIPWRFLKEKLTDAVKYHLEIMRLIEKLEEICNILFLVEFLITLIVLCFQIYNATKNTSDVIQMFSRGSEICCVILQLSVLCYWAEQVMFESAQVGDALYKSDFIGTDLRFQKAMVLMIRRTQNVASITAGKFTRVQLATLMWIVKTSYSAFTMIRSVKHP